MITLNSINRTCLAIGTVAVGAAIYSANQIYDLSSRCLDAQVVACKEVQSTLLQNLQKSDANYPDRTWSIVSDFVKETIAKSPQEVTCYEKISCSSASPYYVTALVCSAIALIALGTVFHKLLKHR